MSWVDLTEQEQRSEREIDWTSCRRRLGQTATIEQVMRGDFAIQCSVPSLVVAIQSIESNENDPTRALRTNRTLLTCILADETGSIVGNIETSLVTRTDALEEYDVLLIEPVPLLTVNNMPTIFVVQSRIRGIIKHNQPLSEPHVLSSSIISQQPFDRSQIESQLNRPINQSQQHQPQQPIHHQSQQSHSVAQSNQSIRSQSPSSASNHHQSMHSQVSHQVSQQQNQQRPVQQQQPTAVNQSINPSAQQLSNRGQNAMQSPIPVHPSQSQPQSGTNIFSRKMSAFDVSDLDDLDM